MICFPCRILDPETEEMAMDFYRHAWRAGAEEYGKARAERYGLAGVDPADLT